MQITVYRNFAKEKNSTKIPTGGEVVSCVLKVPTTRLNPTFILDMTDTTITHIKWDDRYYFVNDYNHMTNNITEYVCSVDAMGSWKTSIGSSSQYVVRSASEFDTYVIDTMYPTTTNMGRVAFPISGLSDISTDNGTFVLGIMNGIEDTSGGAIAYYAFTPAGLRQFMEFMFDGSYLAVDKDLVNPSQYIISCMWYPFAISGTSPARVYFGYWAAEHEGTELWANLINENSRLQTFIGSVTIDEHPGVADRGKYMNCNPYRSAIASVYGFGQMPLDTMYLVNDQTVNVTIKVDIFTGMGTLVIYTLNAYEVIRNQTQFGVPFQLSQFTNSTSIGSRLLGAVGQGVQAVGEWIGGGSSVLLSQIGSAGDAYKYKDAKVTSIGSNGDITNYTFTPVILVDYMDVVGDDNARLGKPLFKHRTISSLSGYIKCASVDIEIPATQTEKDMIVSYMEGGFYYE